MSDKKVLKFNKWFYQPIKNENKTTTIRTEHKGLCADDDVKFKFTNGETINAKIKNISRIRYGRLTNENAFNEGYSDVDLLKKELTDIYGELTDKTPLYIISFEIENGKLEQLTKAISSSMREALF